MSKLLQEISKLLPRTRPHTRAFSHLAEPETTQPVRVGLRNMLRYIEKM